MVQVFIGVESVILKTLGVTMNSTLVRWGALALMIGTLAACGGGGGDDTTVAAPPAGGGAAAPAASTVAVPTGTAPVTFTALTATQIAALTPAVTVGGVTIASPPVVTFAVWAASPSPGLAFRGC